MLGIPPEAKLPNSQALLMYRQRSGYLTATTEWYVMGLTLELDGSIIPCVDITDSCCLGVQYCLNVTCHGRRVTACCSIQASRTRDREKFTVVPSSSWGSTIMRNWACSFGWAARNCASRPGRTVFTVRRSRAAYCVSWSVHKLPKACSPLPRTWLRMASLHWRSG